MGNGIYAATSGAMVQSAYLDVIANNLANSETTGFKADDLRFSDHFIKAQRSLGEHVALAREAPPLATNLAERHQGYVNVANLYTDLSSGTKRHTEEPLDLAIEGDAYFKVQSGTNTYYTRDGRLHVDEAGELATANGAKLLDEGGNPIKLDSTQVQINDEGKITKAGQQVGRVGLFSLPDPASIKKVGTTFLSYDNAQEPAVAAEKAVVMQGYIETSNVNPMREMTRMIQVNRAFEMMNKVVKAFRDLDSQAISEVGGQRQS